MTFHSLTVALMVIGLILFFMGFHAIDNAWNMSSTCWDNSIDGSTKYTKSELYRNGLASIFMSAAFMVSAIFLSNVRVKKSLNLKWNNN